MKNKDKLPDKLVDKAIQIVRLFSIERIEKFKKSYLLIPEEEYILAEHLIKGRSIREILSDLRISHKTFLKYKDRLLKLILQDNYQTRHPLIFICDNATEEQMRYRCKLLNKTENTTNFCVDAFVHKFKIKNLAFKYNKVDEFGYLKEDDVRKLKSKLKNELEAFILVNEI